jgi:hypothetical protein
MQLAGVRADWNSGWACGALMLGGAAGRLLSIGSVSAAVPRQQRPGGASAAAAVRLLWVIRRPE